MVLCVKDGETVLHIAAKNGDSAIVEMLLRDSRFSEINSVDKVCNKTSNFDIRTLS